MGAHTSPAGAKTLSLILPEDVEEAASSLLSNCCDQDLSLATAESCTGGLLASLLTDVEGASHAFTSGFVAYTEDAKVEMLGIPRPLLNKHSAVSEPVARAMAEGARERSGASVALAITGYAGKAPPGDEAGHVYFACAFKNGETCAREEFFESSDRGEVRIAALRVALQMMQDAVAELTQGKAT